MLAAISVQLQMGSPETELISAELLSASWHMKAKPLIRSFSWLQCC